VNETESTSTQLAVEPTPGAAPVPGTAMPTIHRRTNCDRFIEHIQIANAKIQGHLDVAALRRLLDLGQADFDAVAHPILDAINAVVRGEQPGSQPRFADCPKCGEPLEAPSPEVAVENLATWQKARPVYFQWSPYELRKLLEHLHQQPGHVLLPPQAARSVTIQEPKGRVYTYRHDGKVS
jgi:hypothetical protein